MLDAVLAVGGLGQFAAGNRAHIVRVVNGQETSIKVKLDDLVSNGDTRQNIPLMPGDVLVVPQSTVLDERSPRIHSRADPRRLALPLDRHAGRLGGVHHRLDGGPADAGHLFCVGACVCRYPYAPEPGHGRHCRGIQRRLAGRGCARGAAGRSAAGEGGRGCHPVLCRPATPRQKAAIIDGLRTKLTVEANGAQNQAADLFVISYTDHSRNTRQVVDALLKLFMANALTGSQRQCAAGPGVHDRADRRVREEAERRRGPACRLQAPACRPGAGPRAGTTSRA